MPDRHRHATTVTAGSETPGSATLRFRGLEIAVDSNDPAPIGWLEEFLRPHLHDDTVATRRHEVRVVIDHRRYEQMLADTAGHAEREMDCFALDGQFERHTLKHDGPDGRLIHNAKADCFFLIGNDGSDTRLFARSDSAKFRVVLMRVVRELATLHSLHHGDLFLHAAGVVFRGNAVVIAGPKRAGKSTLLLSALREPGTRFLANDRVLVEPISGGATAHGMPTIIKVRPDFSQFLPTLTEPARGREHRHYLTLDECENGSPLMEPALRQPAAMSPVQLCRWLNVQPVAQAPIAALIFPGIDATIPGFQLNQLDVVNAAGRIWANLFSAGPGGLVAEAFRAGWDGFPDPDAVRDTCRRLAERHSCYDCRLGPGAFQRPSVWDAIVASIF